MCVSLVFFSWAGRGTEKLNTAAITAQANNKTGKKTITIDLNPLSRTSQTSDISIVDNVVRAFPFMTEIAKDLKTQDKQLLINMINDFDNRKNLKEALKLFKNK